MSRKIGRRSGRGREEQEDRKEGRKREGGAGWEREGERERGEGREGGREERERGERRKRGREGREGGEKEEIRGVRGDKRRGIEWREGRREKVEIKSQKEKVRREECERRGESIRSKP